MVAGVRRRIEPRAIVMAIVIAVLLIIVVYPLFLLLLHSFDIHGEFPFAKYQEAFTKPQNAIALGNSLYTSAVVPLLKVLIGTGMAWLITRSDLPIKR